MKIKLTSNCIVEGKAEKAGKELDLAPAVARPLVLMGKAESLEPKEEKVELTVSIDPKELETVKEQLEAKDTEITELKEQLETCKGEAKEEVNALNEQIAELKEQLEDKKSKKAK